MGKDTARVAREAHKAAQAARQEAKAAALDAAEKQDAYDKALDHNIDMARRSAAAAAANTAASSSASIAELAHSPEAPKLRAAAKAAEKAADDARQAAEEASKAVEEAKVAKVAAEKVEADTEAAADALESQDGAAAATLAAETAAADRAAARDAEHGQVGTTKEVELDVEGADAARATATAARAAAREGYESEAKAIAKVRDEAARDKWKNEQDAKAADMQVKKEQGEVGKLQKEIARLNRDADAAAKKGDAPLADSLREKAEELSSDQRLAESRLADAQQAGDAANTAAQASDEVVKEAEGNLRELQQQRTAAEPALDGLEERARLLEEAKSKLAEAAQTGNERLRQEAEALVQQAEKIHVDRAAIKELAPDLPDEATPAAAPEGAAEPGPAPPEAKEPGEAGAGAAPVGVNPEKVSFIREEIAKGNHVSIGPDGVPASIEPKTPPSPEQIQKNLETFDRDVSSGKFNEEMAKGHSYQSNPDGTGGYAEPESSAGEPPAGGEGGGSGPPPDAGQAGNPDLSAAELRELTVKYSNAAQAVHQQRVDAMMPSDDYEKNTDTKLQLKGLRAQLEETSKVRAEWPGDIKKHQDNAERLNHEATQLDRQGKSKEAEEKREQADLETGTAKGLEKALGEIDEREATIKARVEELQKDNEAFIAGAPARKQQQEQLEGTADKLDDVARTMGDAYRAKLDADELRTRAAQAGDNGNGDLKSQLEQQAQAADARSSQLLQQARQLVPQDDVARKALDEAGVVQEPPASPPAAESQPDATGGDAQTQDAGAADDVTGDDDGSSVAGGDAGGKPEAEPGDVVGDEEPATPNAAGATAEEAGAETGAVEAGQPAAGSDAGSSDGPDSGSTQPVDQSDAFVASDQTGSTDDTDPGVVSTPSVDDGSGDASGHDAFEEQASQPVVAFEDQQPTASEEAEGEFV